MPSHSIADDTCSIGLWGIFKPDIGIQSIDQTTFLVRVVASAIRSEKKIAGFLLVTLTKLYQG